MAEGTYEYECMRAELLGIEVPDLDEFNRKQAEEKLKAEEENVDVDNLKVAEEQDETLQGTTGKLDELNQILAATQKKIDRFKFRCGSVTELIKTKIGSISGGGGSGAGTSNGSVTCEGSKVDSSSSDEPVEGVQTPEADSVSGECDTKTMGSPQRKTQLTRALDNHVDKLDALLDKAETAEIRMSVQNKDMKRFLR